MAADEIHVGDVGTQFIITIMDGDTVIDVSAASAKRIVFRKPDGVQLIKTASFVLTGADGRIQCFMVSGDLDLSGPWRVQAYVVFPSGEWRSDVREFTVYPNG